MNSEQKFFKRLMLRFYLIVTLLLIFSFSLIGKLIYIQFYENKKGLSLRSETIVKNVVLEPSRGNIYSVDGNILAISIPRFELHWDAIIPSDYLFNANKKSLADSISSLINIPSNRILRSLEKARDQNNRYWLVDKDISYSEY